MDFTTKIKIPPTSNPIDYDAQLLAMGSCFAQSMAEKFDYFKFNHTTNPFGIIFNPVSMGQLLARIVAQKAFTADDLFFHNERWQSFELHSDCSHSDKAQLLEDLNQRLALAHQSLSTATHLLITYGTAWVYRFKASGQIVANCHKVPQKEFDKILLSPQEIAASMRAAIDAVRTLNPACSFVLTVSPVRHIKDGFFENNVSKGHLFSALHQLLAAQSAQVTYFPSYELLMDELRDYRFYADDLLHPSPQAVNYIWERFFSSYMQPATIATMNEVCALQRSLKHRPFNPDSESHRQFLADLKQKAESLADRFPQIKF